MDPESILVVDDDRDVASTVSEYLTREGHTVILAHSGRDGLTRLREGAVALLLVDLRLPDMDGIEVMHAAQRAPNPPEIVVITGYATVSSAVQAVEGGTAGYLEKPFEMPRLAAIVQRVMGRRRLMRENMHLQAETASRLREMEVMLSISRTASATLDVQEALRRICRELVFLVGADTGAAYLLDEPSGRLMPTAGYHVPKEMMEAFLSHPIPLGEQGFRQEIWETRQPVFSDDVYSDPRFNFELFRTFRHQSGLVLPLLLDDSVAGAFYFAWWKAKKVFTRRELELAENVAAQVTMVLRHARLFERADREWRQLQVLFDALDREGAREHGFHACLGVPLQIQGQILGCLERVCQGPPQVLAGGHLAPLGAGRPGRAGHPQGPALRGDARPEGGGHQALRDHRPPRHHPRRGFGAGPGRGQDHRPPGLRRLRGLRPRRGARGPRGSPGPPPGSRHRSRSRPEAG